MPKPAVSCKRICNATVMSSRQRGLERLQRKAVQALANTADLILLRRGQRLETHPGEPHNVLDYIFCCPKTSGQAQGCMCQRKTITAGAVGSGQESDSWQTLLEN